MRAVGIVLRKSLSSCLFSLILTVSQSTALGAAVSQESSAELSSEESRAEELRSRRRQRLANVKPSQPSKVVEVLATMENDGFDQLVTFQVRHWRFGFGKISPISSFTPAIQYERPRLGNTDLHLLASGAYSLIGYQVYDVRFGKFNEPVPYEFLSDGYLGAPFAFDRRSQAPLEGFLYADLRYRNFPREDFYGLGPDSSEDDRTDYRYEEAAFDAVAGYPFTRWFGIKGRAGYLLTNVGPGTIDDRPSTQDLFDDSTAPGLERQPDFFHLDAGLYLAYEDDPNLPSGILGVQFSRFDDINDRRFEFNRLTLDARGYLPLGSRQRTLAGRFYVVRDYADDPMQIPFYFMKTLGGRDTLRGYKDFRFRDSNLIYLSSEYRWEATTGVELAAFYDTGKVFSQDTELSFDHLRHSFGVGIRAKSMRRTVFRIDLGRSEEGTFVYFAFGPSL